MRNTTKKSQIIKEFREKIISVIDFHNNMDSVMDWEELNNQLDGVLIKALDTLATEVREEIIDQIKKESKSAFLGHNLLFTGAESYRIVGIILREVLEQLRS